MEKMTQKDYFKAIKDVLVANGEDALAEFVDERIAALDKKSANRKPTKAQVENEGLKDAIYDGLVAMGEPVTVTELIKGTDALVGLTSQKVTSLLTQMKKAGRVDSATDKRVTRYFAVVAE
jgi:hypothetical protein